MPTPTALPFTFLRFLEAFSKYSLLLRHSGQLGCNFDKRSQRASHLAFSQLNEL